MKKIVVFGATGGIGKKLIPLLETKYNVIALGSKDVDITKIIEVYLFFEQNDFDIVLNLSGKKYDVFLNEITKEDHEQILDMINVNILGTINILGGCLPKMRDKKYGRVISISSIFAEKNIPKNGIYCSSKAFIDRLISVANKENIEYGITCNTIQLGYWGDGMGENVSDEIQKKTKNKIGLKRYGTTEELFKTIDFIINNEYVCGTNLKIDGGL